MPLGLNQKVKNKFKVQAKLEKNIEDIGMSDVKDAVIMTNQLLQKLCIFTFRYIHKDFNGDFDVLCDVVEDLSPDLDKLILKNLKRILYLSGLNTDNFKSQKFSDFVKEQADLEEKLNKI